MSNEKGEDTLELGPPINARGKLEQLVAFVMKHGDLGGLDLRFLQQCLDDLRSEMYVTRLKLMVKTEARSIQWTLRMCINNKKDFDGNGPAFEDALISMLEAFEDYVNAAEAS